MSTSFRVQRGRVAVLTRFRDPTDPELLDARRRMGEEALVEAVAKAVAKAPPITSSLRQRVLNLVAVVDRGVD